MSEVIKILIVVSGIVGINGLNLECALRNESWKYVKGLYCTPNNVLIEKQEVLTSFNNQGYDSYIGSELKILSFYRQTVYFVPQGIGKFFPNLEGFEIRYSKLKIVSKTDLQQFPKLKQLYLVGNDLTALPGNLLDANPELIGIYFHSNKLKHIDAILIDSLKELRYASFGSDPCISGDYGEGWVQNTFSKLKNDLKSQCKVPGVEPFLQQIDQLKSQLSSSEVNLATVTGQNNQLKSQLSSSEVNLATVTGQNNQLKSQLSSSEANLATMTGQNNQLKSQLSSSDANLDAATRFIFTLMSHYDGIEKESEKNVTLKCKFDSDAKTCHAVEFAVKVMDSQITKFVDENDKEIDQTSSPIQKLVISHQKTLFLPSNLAEKLPNLVEISITDSGFFRIDSDTFANLTALTSMIISQNKLREVHTKSFNEKVNLRFLDLSSNKIELLTDDAFESLSNLRTLDLSSNLLTSMKLEHFAFLKSLEILNLKTNNLKSLDYGLFTPMPELVTVDISDNELEILSGDLVAVENKITEFRAAGNKLTVIKQPLIRRLKKSQVIDFSGNNCINVIYNNNSATSVTIEILMSKISLECADNDY